MGCPKLTYLSAVRHDHPRLSLVKSGNRDFSFIGKEVAGAYVYGYQGQEKDDEMKGTGNSYDFGARMYDSRLGRLLSIDAYSGKYPSHSPYSFVVNKPLILIDPDGNKLRIGLQNRKQEEKIFKVLFLMNIKDI
jgi:RHS repeat-associated protein